MNTKQIIGLASGIISALTLGATDVLSSNITLPSSVTLALHIAIGMLAVASGVLGAVTQLESAATTPPSS
jgi:acyl-[acyl carrier protein]--UDP-N-acetylglucosamine O-acyltransferase